MLIQSVSRQTTHQNQVIYHQSATGLKSFFDDAYKDARPGTNDSTAVGVLVNHHLFGAHFIAESFTKIATNRPVTLLLISPNHFNTGSGVTITSEAAWKTPFGVLEPDLDTIEQLKKKHIVQVEESPFEQEHGISGIVPFVKHSLPNAKIIPLIVKEGLPMLDALEIAKQVKSTLPNNTLIVGSFDFSHYLTHRAADFHDISSLSVVQNFEYSKIPRLDVDSHPGLAMFLKLLELLQAQNFHPEEHSNSAVLARTDNILETTSYITGYFSTGQVSPPLIPHTLLVTGNIDANTKTISSLDRHSPSFSIKFLERLFFGQDTTAVFVEQSPSLAQKLSKLKINAQITKNTDFALGTLKISYLRPQSGQDPISIAKRAIESGADIALLSGPLGKVETYKGKLIFSGLGELLTEHTLSFPAPSYSLALGFSATQDRLTIHLLPIQVQKGIAQLITSPSDGIVLKELLHDTKLNPDIEQQILSGVITINLKSYGTK